jgi:uncharacterized protein involved in type VI secretion and phage assembly
MERGLEEPFAELAERVGSKYWGKYRGLVQSADDPEDLGRVEVKVPSVYGPDLSVFALPAVPFAGPGYGVMFLPRPNDGVWVEFEGGDPSLPIWTGFWWARNELPGDVSADKRVIVTPAGLKVVLDDGDKKIRILNARGEITLAEDAITIKFGQARIVLNSAGVAINNTSFRVMG